jgi:hypothetical protein
VSVSWLAEWKGAAVHRLGQHPVREHGGRLDVEEIGSGALGTFLETMPAAARANLDPPLERNQETRLE